ncbi:hypothetical protein C8039_04025 [Halogeometricum sp. wsp3]|nr:hypothetical protein C8039_04025 [Halogeometricum sp. wsp3]
MQSILGDVAFFTLFGFCVLAFLGAVVLHCAPEHRKEMALRIDRRSVSRCTVNLPAHPQLDCAIVESEPVDPVVASRSREEGERYATAAMVSVANPVASANASYSPSVPSGRW